MMPLNRVPRAAVAALVDDEGMSLVELLVAVAIAGGLVFAVANGIALGLRATADTEQRLLESNDLGLVASYLPRDVASSRTVSTSDEACWGGPPLLHLQWRDEDVEKMAVYAVRSDAGRSLVRRYCELRPGDAAPVVVHETVTVRLGSVDPTVACGGGCSSPSWVAVDVSLASGGVHRLLGSRRVTA